MIMSNLLVEDNFDTSSSQDSKWWYIEGVFAQAGVKNKNGRIYSEAIMDRECELFSENFVKVNRAGGELTHPDHSSIDPHNVAIKIESIVKNGLDYMGRAKVLNTTSGKTIQALLEGGLVIGVSTRGRGTVTTRGGIAYVNDDFNLITIDAVMNPSAPKALVDAVYEGVYDSLAEKTMLFKEFCEFMEQRNAVKNIKSPQERQVAMLESVKAVISAMTKTNK